jgi:uncharacterized protein (UPF0333 family)
MFRFSLGRLLLAVLLVAFFVGEGLFAAYVHRTKARMNEIYQATEAAANRAEAATR